MWFKQQRCREVEVGTCRVNQGLCTASDLGGLPAEPVGSVPLTHGVAAATWGTAALTLFCRWRQGFLASTCLLGREALLAAPGHVPSGSGPWQGGPLGSLCYGGWCGWQGGGGRKWPWTDSRWCLCPARKTRPFFIMKWRWMLAGGMCPSRQTHQHVTGVPALSVSDSLESMELRRDTRGFYRRGWGAEGRRWGRRGGSREWVLRVCSGGLWPRKSRERWQRPSRPSEKGESACILKVL